MASIKNANTSDFIALFNRDLTPYMLPFYDSSKAYFTGDIVYYNSKFYESQTDANTTAPTDTENWKLANVSASNYITENDILRAFSEAKVNFNPTLFDCDDEALMVFYYLAMHYLVIDITNALSPMTTGFIGFTQSKSVGSISESYGIPQWMLNNALLSGYAQTGYGRKYLSLIQPYLVGNIIITKGAINLG